MTNEEKQALIERCEQRIKELSKVQFGIMHKEKLDLLIYCQALKSLCTKPVRLPNKIERDDADGYWMHKSGRVSAVNAAYFNEALSECKEALNAQGYEVQE